MQCLILLYCLLLATCATGLVLRHTKIAHINYELQETLAPVVILHGLLGSQRNFGSWSSELHSKLSGRADIYTMDLRNHGLSPRHPSMEYEDQANDIQETLASCGVHSAHLIGHSMGGKVAAALALRQQRRNVPMVKTLTMLDIMPVAYTHSTFEDVQQVLDSLCTLSRIELETNCRDTVLRQVSDLNEDENMAQFVMSSMQWRDGQLKWTFDLDSIRQSMDVIREFVTQDAAVPYVGDTLVLKGARSSFVRPEHTAAVAQLFPRHRIESVADAGHWLHIDQPHETVQKVADFILRSSGNDDAFVSTASKAEEARI